MIAPKMLTTDDLRELLVVCLQRPEEDKPPATKKVFRERLSAALHDDSPSIDYARQIYAAGLLTYGDLSMVDIILDNLTSNISSGCATGYCVAAGSTVISAMLPLPDHLLTTGRTVLDEAPVRAWFEQHRQTLRFDARVGRFRLYE